MKTLVAMVVALELTACGGGGSSVTSLQAPTSLNTVNSNSNSNSIAITKLNSFTIDYTGYGGPNTIYNHRSGLLVDLDGDGTNEYVFSISPAPQVPVPLTVIGFQNGAINLTSIGFQNGAINLTSKYFPNGAPAVKHSPFIFYEDINGDGKKDIIASDAGLDAPPWTGSKIGIALNTGNNSFTNISDLLPDTTARNYSITYGDFNADGKKDILLSNQDTSAIGSPTLLNYANGNFQSLPIAISNTDWRSSGLDRVNSYYTADFNGDGYDDLLLGGMWHGRTNTIVYGGPKGLDVTTLKELAHCPYGQDGWDYRTEPQPSNRIINSCEVYSISFDFNNDGKPDVFSTAIHWIRYAPGQITDKTVSNYAALLKDGGTYFGQSVYTTATNVDGNNFVNKIPANSDLGYKFYYSMILNDVNRDGNMDVIGHYVTLQSNINLGRAMYGTTFFINDGKGNFSVIDAADVFPELVNYPYKDIGDNRAQVGSIIPIRNTTTEFTGLQLVDSPNRAGKYTVQGFTTNQISKLKYVP